MTSLIARMQVRQLLFLSTLAGKITGEAGQKGGVASRTLVGADIVDGVVPSVSYILGTDICDVRLHKNDALFLSENFNFECV